MTTGASQLAAGKFIIALVLFIFPVVSFAQQPKWVKSEHDVYYPQATFLTAVGKGQTLKDAEADSKKLIVSRFADKLAENGIDGKTAEGAETLLLKPYKTAYTHKDGGSYYVFGAVDKNLVAMDCKDQISVIEGRIHDKIDILDTSNAKPTGKIKQIDEILLLYSQESFLNMLAGFLRDSRITSEVSSFERDSLADLKKELYKNVNFVLRNKNFNDAKVQAFCSENGIAVLSSAPAEHSGEKSYAYIDTKIQLSTAGSGKYSWTAEVIVTDGKDDGTALYSDKSSGEESSPVETAAKEKARLFAEEALNDMIIKFLKTTL
ncbi:MAG: hypothetical protein FWC57_02475 [Endomicrobia bacterium]|nr:hypothetical protein [Endomicrobiia bacterium]